MRTIRITEQESFIVGFNTTKEPWDACHTLRTGCLGNIPLDIMHSKTSVRAYTNMLNQIVAQLKGRKMQRKMHKLIASINGTPSVIKDVVIKGSDEYPLNKSIYLIIA